MSTEAFFRIAIFSKSGCEKCRKLQQRVDKLLSEGEWSDFEKSYHDVETEEGLALFCRMECVNPNRIPAFVLMTRDTAGAWKPMPRSQPGAPDPVCGASRLYIWIGLQTDYSEQGKGVISTAMIRAVLEEARAQRPAVALT